MQNHSEFARSLLGQMTLREKIAQMYSVWLRMRDDGSVTLRVTQMDKRGELAGDPFEIMKDGIGQISRPLGTQPIHATRGVRGLNLIQKFLVERTRLGIPALPHEECLAGVMAQGATLFPAGLNLGSLWDVEKVGRVAASIGDELVSVGAKQGLAPVLDVSRDVRWGRTEETMGEDPYLVGCLALAYAKGLQGERRRALATLKHFVGHSFSEGGRNHAPVHIGERELYDTFMLPFEMVVKSIDAGSVLPAYHDIDGVPLHASRELLTGILRKRWGFSGLVVSDYQGVGFLHHDHKTANDMAEAAAQAIKAGIDMELPGFECFREGVAEALDRGLVAMAEVDAVVSRVLVEKSRLGLFEKPYADEGAIELNTPHSRAVAAEAASDSIVLLKNVGMLPLDGRGKVALIGPLADERLCMLGGYSFPVHLISAGLAQAEGDAPPIPTLRELLVRRLGDRLYYEKGCDILTARPTESPVFPGELGVEGGIQKTFISRDESGFAAARRAAEESDAVVVAVGDMSGLFLTGTVGEGSDASSLRLPGPQQGLLEALAETGKPMAVVLFNGRPYHLGEMFERADAIVEAWLPGQEGAAAVDGVLFGEINPGGKLPLSIPKEAGAMPFYYNYKVKSAGTPIQNEFGAEYPFGFGLSYTSFALDSFCVERLSVPTDGEAVLSLRVANTGEREGDEVVQLYVRDLYASVVRPLRELKGFKRVRLKPRESIRLTFTVPTDVLSFTGLDYERIVEPGDFCFMIGTSSRDIRFQETIHLEGDARRLGESWRMFTGVKAERLD